MKVEVNVLLSRQKYTCRDKTSVVTKLCLSRKKRRFFLFIFFRQTRVCRDKHIFAATKDVFCCDKNELVATKLCLRETDRQTDRVNKIASTGEISKIG